MLLSGQAVRFKNDLENAIETEGWYENSQCSIEIDKARQNMLVVSVVFEGEVDETIVSASEKWITAKLDAISMMHYAKDFDRKNLELKDVTQAEHKSSIQR